MAEFYNQAQGANLRYPPSVGGAARIRQEVQAQRSQRAEEQNRLRQTQRPTIPRKTFGKTLKNALPWLAPGLGTGLGLGYSLTNIL